MIKKIVRYHILLYLLEQEEISNFLFLLWHKFNHLQQSCLTWLDGKECKSDLNVLGSRVMSRDSFMDQQGSDTFLTLVSTNRERDEINEKEMAKKNRERNDGITYVAEIVGKNNQDPWKKGKNSFFGRRTQAIRFFHKSC